MVSETYIIIVTYNGIKWIDKCLNSCGNFNIIIIDNASKDSTVNFIEANYPRIKLFKQKNNLGFGKANNLGISYALSQGAEYVFLLNQDAYLEPTTIINMISVHKLNTEFGLLSPIHLNGEGTKLDENFSSYLSYKNNNTFYFDALKNKMKPIYNLPFVNAAAWLLPKKTIEEIGGFDPIFFHYGEDDNYCQRLLFHGFKIGVVSNVYVRHDREFESKREIRTESEKLKKDETYFKVIHGNINEELNMKLHFLKINFKLFIKFLLQFKFKQLKYTLKKGFLISRIKPEIIKSRKINSKKGKHYISN